MIFENWRVVDTLNRFWGPQERQSPFDSRIEETGVMKWATTQLVWLIPLVVKVAMPGDILAKDLLAGVATLGVIYFVVAGRPSALAISDAKRYQLLMDRAKLVGEGVIDPTQLLAIAGRAYSDPDYSGNYRAQHIDRMAFWAENGLTSLHGNPTDATGYMPWGWDRTLRERVVPALKLELAEALFARAQPQTKW